MGPLRLGAASPGPSKAAVLGEEPGRKGCWVPFAKETGLHLTSSEQLVGTLKQGVMWQFKSGKEIWVADRENGFITDWGQSKFPDPIGALSQGSAEL